MPHLVFGIFQTCLLFKKKEKVGAWGLILGILTLESKIFYYLKNIKSGYTQIKCFHPWRNRRWCSHVETFFFYGSNNIGNSLSVLQVGCTGFWKHIVCLVEMKWNGFSCLPRIYMLLFLLIFHAMKVQWTSDFHKTKFCIFKQTPHNGLTFLVKSWPIVLLVKLSVQYSIREWKVWIMLTLCFTGVWMF